MNDDLARHGEIMGGLARIDQKVDGLKEATDKVHKRHESAISDNTKNIDELKGFRARFKGGAWIVAIAGSIATVAVKAREWF